MDIVKFALYIEKYINLPNIKYWKMIFMCEDKLNGEKHSQYSLFDK